MGFSKNLSGKQVLFNAAYIKVLTAWTTSQLKNAKSLRRRASAKIKRYGKSAWKHAKNVHQVRTIENCPTITVVVCSLSNHLLIHALQI